MSAASTDQLEERIRARCDANDQTAAATLLLEGYGREILGFLILRLRDRDAAGDVFSQFTEDLWRGLGGFRWQCSARVWAYTLARHAASRYIRDVRQRRGRNVPISQAGPLSEIEARIRTSTMAAARTDARSRIAKLRETLPLDDQTLIVLRVNRKLAWKEIAQVMFYEGTVVADDVLEKEAVRLRKRYQLSTKKLREMAREQGLTTPDGD